MLYVVPTPIGNIEDMTVRGIRILRDATFIICEDPRVTDKLLKLLDIRREQKYIQIIRSHNFNYSEIEKVLNESKYNDSMIALVTDAGTPLISDPGYEIILMVQGMGLEYTVLPGATSIIPAAAASGLVSKEFLYLGFLPTKKGRQKIWKDIIRSQYPIIILESVHRISKLISEMQLNLTPQTRIFIARELTKKFEQYSSTTVENISIDDIAQKGEFVIVIQPETQVTKTNKHTQDSV